MSSASVSSSVQSLLTVIAAAKNTGEIAIKCADLMTTDVECCDADESIAFVAERMRMRNTGFVPVCNGNGAIVGTITDRDLVVRVLAEELDGAYLHAREVMTPEFIACKPSDSIEQVEELMTKHHALRLVCVDDEKRPVGVISLWDVTHLKGAA